MSTPSCSISLADLRDAGIGLHPSEAVAATLDVIRRALRGNLPGIPSADALRFSSDGSIHVDGPVTAGATIERAARLLDSLLPPFDAPPEHRTPGALRIIVARALHSLDLPAFESVTAFADAIARFGTDDAAAAGRALCERWAHVVGAPPETRDTARAAATASDVTVDGLTISDVRRARRSTGLTLGEIAERSRIPVSLLRELEWGYFVNWPDGHYGRIQLVRYARAAGLDEGVVIRAVWPVLEEAIRTRPVIHAPAVGALEDSGQADTLVKARVAAPARRAVHEALRPRPVLAVISIAALLGVALLPASWNSRAQMPEPAPQTIGAIRQVSSAAELLPPARLQEEIHFSPAFATGGSAVFYRPASTNGLTRAGTEPHSAVLRVTRIVDDGAQSFHARPSPDGRLIAFDSDREGERAVYLADARGQNVRRVSGNGFAAVPSWSPDGRRLAFVRAEADRPRVWNLWLFDLESGESARLTSHRVGRVWGAAWFPDSDRIAYAHETRLIVRDLEGGLEDIYPGPDDRRVVRTPAVSPDGQRVVFQVEGNGAWLLNLVDKSTRPVVQDPTAEEFIWAPDGGKVAYYSRKSGTWSVWVAAAR